MTEPIVIKVENLDKEAKRITNHIEELIKSRDNLYKEKNFSMSIGTSVLIIEEIAKLHLIVQHKRSKKPIRKTEWESMYKHKQKLTRPFKRLSAKMEKLPLDEMAKAAEKVRPNLGAQILEMIKLFRGWNLIF